MSTLTKEQLRSELVSHGVDLPSPSAKKSEYVKKYEKYVAPIASSKGDFSSDDEDLPVNDVRAQVSAPGSVCAAYRGGEGVKRREMAGLRGNKKGSPCNILSVDF